MTTPDNHTPGEAIATNLNFSEQIPRRYRLHLDGTQVDEFVIFYQHREWYWLSQKPKLIPQLRNRRTLSFLISIYNE